MGVNAGISASLGRAGKMGAVAGAAGWAIGSVSDVFLNAERRKQRWAEQHDYESVMSKSPNTVIQQQAGIQELLSTRGVLTMTKSRIDANTESRYRAYIRRYGYQNDVLMRVSDALHYRNAWDFIKCEGVNVIAGNDAIATAISEAYNEGFTLWHDFNVLNYDRANDEV